MTKAEDFDRICRELRAEDATGFIIRQAYLGDHIRLTDGTDLGPMLDSYTVEGNVILECQEGLPESARNKDGLELVFTLRENLSYFFKEDETMYVYTVPLDEEQVTIAISNNGRA